MKTIKIGTRIKHDSSEYILAQTRSSHIQWINLNDGNRWNEGCGVRHVQKITYDELMECSDGMKIERIKGLFRLTDEEFIEQYQIEYFTTFRNSKSTVTVFGLTYIDDFQLKSYVVAAEQCRDFSNKELLKSFREEFESNL